MSTGIKSFISNLRKKRIIEILAAFIGGGWLLLEFVHWLLVDHYHFPEKTIDITFVTILSALLCTLIWRWFGGIDKPRKFKPELVLIPLVILVTVLLDINLLLHLKGIEPETFPAAKWKNSIAVLPFVDMSPQKDQEYFCDGMTEDLINRLSNVKELKVPARTSVFMFKGKTPDMHDVGEKLKVQTVLEGSVQKSENRLRITAQLINIADGYHLWSERYDRELKDVFAIQDEISSSIAEALRLKLTPQEKQRISDHPIDNVTAYQFYLRAMREISQMTEDSLNRALQNLQTGINLMGDNALLYSGMADVYFLYTDMGLRQEDFLKKAEEYAQKALTLDPKCPLAHIVLGRLSFYNKDFPENMLGYLRHIKLVLAVDPYNGVALDRIVWLLSFLGKPDAALPYLKRMKQVDPMNPSNLELQTIMDVYAGKWEHAIEPNRQLFQLYPENPFSQFYYAWALAENKNIDEALSIIDQGTKAAPDNVFTKFGLLLKYGLQKDREKAFLIMTPEFQETCRRDCDWSYHVAALLSLLDAKKEALDWLENAINRGLINYPALEREPFLDNIRSEPRFKKLMERVKYEWEHFEV
jgi:TolB-like protein